MLKQEFGVLYELYGQIHLAAKSRTMPQNRAAKTAGDGASKSERPRILVVEDEALVAMQIADILTDAGFAVVGPTRTVSAALDLLGRSGCDAAVLDINLGKETSEPIALELIAQNIPFVSLSGYAKDQHPPIFAKAPALSKPFRAEYLISALKKCLTR